MCTPIPQQFDTISDLFKKHPSNFETAESDGVLCGLLCANNALTYQDWFSQCFDHNTPPTQAFQPYFKARAQLFSDIDDGFRFSPLIPELNETNTQSCTQALKKWCTGFMYGLGLNISQQSLQNNPSSFEALHDLANISQLDTENITNTNDEQESYLELLEYVRLTVWTIDQDMRIQVFKNPQKQPANANSSNP